MSDVINEDTKEIFHIPNFIINDPVFKKVYKEDTQVENTLEVNNKLINFYRLYSLIAINKKSI